VDGCPDSPLGGMNAATDGMSRPAPAARVLLDLSG
jgi:hypothetical protein